MKEELLATTGNNWQLKRSEPDATGTKYHDLLKHITMLITNMLNNYKIMNKTNHWAGINLSNHNQTSKVIFKILVGACICTVKMVDRVDIFGLHPKFVEILVVKPWLVIAV